MAQIVDNTLEGRILALEATLRDLLATNRTNRAAVELDGEVVTMETIAGAPAAAIAAQETATAAATAAGTAAGTAASAQQIADDAAATAATAIANAATAQAAADAAEATAGAVSGDVASAQQAADDAAAQAAAALQAAQDASTLGTNAQQAADTAASAAAAAQEAADQAGTAAAQADADAAAAAAQAAQAIADADAAADAAATAQTAASNAQGTANTAVTNAATAQTAAIAALTAQTIARNATFADWPAGNTYPTGWYQWSPTPPTKEAATVRTAPYALRWNVGAVDAGIAEGNAWDDLPVGLEYVTVEVDFLLASGSLTGAGFLLDWAGMSNNRATLSLAAEVPTPTLNRWHRVTKVLRRPTNATGTASGWAGFLMANFSGLAALTAKNIVFDRVALRPSTVEEITAYGTPAQITTLTTNVGTAQSTANTALSTANGRNRVFVQTTAPTGGTYVAGDLWIDTANGRRLSSWSGSAWTLQRFANGAIEPNTLVGSDVLASGSVLAAQVHADAINGKTITGSTIRTAASGARVQLDSTGGVRGYDAAGNVLSQIGVDGILRATGAIISGEVTAGTGQSVKLSNTAGQEGGGAVLLTPSGGGTAGRLDAATDEFGRLTILRSPARVADGLSSTMVLRTTQAGAGEGIYLESLADLYLEANNGAGAIRVVGRIANGVRFSANSSYYTGAPPASDAELQVRTWTGNLVSSAFGDNTIFWPGGGFPNGMLYCSGAVDGNGGQRVQLWGVNKSQANVRFLNGNGSTATNQTWYVCIVGIGY